MPINELGLPVGAPVEGWAPRARPPRTVLVGRFCRVRPLDAARDAARLFAANSLDREGRMWTYLSYGPFATPEAYRAKLEEWDASEDPQFFAIADAASDAATGVGSYLRIDADNGSIEIGHLQFPPRLQRTPAATEALYLALKQAFELGYRRCEWKCDALNAASRRAAERLGFRFEGVFRQALVYKGRNRDTAWYSIIDAEWPTLATAFETWLDPGNFDASGVQRMSLAEARRRTASSEPDR